MPSWNDFIQTIKHRESEVKQQHMQIVEAADRAIEDVERSIITTRRSIVGSAPSHDDESGSGDGFDSHHRLLGGDADTGRLSVLGERSVFGDRLLGAGLVRNDEEKRGPNEEENVQDGLPSNENQTISSQFNGDHEDQESIIVKRKSVFDANDSEPKSLADESDEENEMITAELDKEMQRLKEKLKDIESVQNSEEALLEALKADQTSALERLRSMKDSSNPNLNSSLSRARKKKKKPKLTRMGSAIGGSNNDLKKSMEEIAPWSSNPNLSQWGASRSVSNLTAPDDGLGSNKVASSMGNINVKHGLMDSDTKDPMTAVAPTKPGTPATGNRSASAGGDVSHSSVFIRYGLTRLLINCSFRMRM
jgi:hypothetical protein